MADLIELLKAEIKRQAPDGAKLPRYAANVWAAYGDMKNG